MNALAFEKHFESNIFELTDEILENRYVIKPSICFIVKKPVKREIFAADFRDRVVHHFIYNPTKDEQKAFLNSMNSYLGIMKHYKTFKERKKMVNKNVSAWWWNYFYVSKYVKLVSRVNPAKSKINKN